MQWYQRFTRSGYRVIESGYPGRVYWSLDDESETYPEGHLSVWHIEDIPSGLVEWGRDKTWVLFREPVKHPRTKTNQFTVNGAKFVRGYPDNPDDQWLWAELPTHRVQLVAGFGDGVWHVVQVLEETICSRHQWAFHEAHTFKRATPTCPHCLKRDKRMVPLFQQAAFRTARLDLEDYLVLPWPD